MILVDSKYGVYSGKNAAKGINRAIQDALNNGIKRVHVPAGSYILEEPLNIETNGFACLTLSGDSSFLDWRNGTHLIMKYNKGYGIGVQMGKGVTVDGFSITGQFTPSDTDFFRMPFESFTDPKIKEDTYNPYAAVCIDPRPTVSGGGSTGTTVRNCRLFNTSVGVANSPNGQSRNSELTLIDRCQFGWNRLAVSGSHDQERNNTIRDCMAWDTVHTFFSSHRYGSDIGGSWNIENCNLAGKINTFIEWTGIGRHQVTVSKINAESIGQFGRMKGFSNVENSAFNFIHPKEYYGIVIDASHGVEFNRCKLRYYGHRIPVNLKGNARYRGCDFEVPPNYGLDPYYNGDMLKPELIDCYVDLEPYQQKEPEYRLLGVQKVSKGGYVISGNPEVGKQILYMANERPWGWYNAGIVTEAGKVSYSEAQGEFNLMAI